MSFVVGLRGQPQFGKRFNSSATDSRDDKGRAVNQAWVVWDIVPLAGINRVKPPTAAETLCR